MRATTPNRVVVFLFRFFLFCLFLLGRGSFFYRVSENFDQWILWNGSGKQGFISIEPQQGAVNALNSGEGLLTLLPEETECYQTCIGRISG